MKHKKKAIKGMHMTGVLLFKKKRSIDYDHFVEKKSIQSREKKVGSSSRKEMLKNMKEVYKLWEK